ncbi:MAG: DUF4837 family protein [Candidatus Latescibacterota bacterium]
MKNYPLASILILLIVTVMVLSVAGCKEMSVPPAGSYSEILLITDEGKNSRFVPLILPWLAIEKDYVLDKERAFTVASARAEALDQLPSVKNIVICGVADPLTDIGKRISTLIGDAAMRKVRNGEANILKKENIPAAGQFTVIITASNEGALERIIEERGDELGEIIELSCRQRLRRHLLSYPNTEIVDHLFAKYGFVLEVPTLYQLMSEEGRPPGVELVRENPTRLIGVFWTDWNEIPTLADSDALYDLRKNYVWERYDKDAMDSTRVWYSQEPLGKYPAVKMEGYWYNTKATAGGYYQTYFIYQDKEQLLWVVDLLAYAPGRSKHPLFREMLALAETFRYE